MATFEGKHTFASIVIIQNIFCSTPGHQKFNYFGSVPMMQANNEWYEVGGTKQLPAGRSDLEFYRKAGIIYKLGSFMQTKHLCVLIHI